MKKYIVIIIILLWTGIASATDFNTEDIEWGAAVSNTLYRDGTLTNGEYAIKVIDFTSPVPGIQIIENNQIKIVPETKIDPVVRLGIYKNGTFIKDIVLTLQSSAYIDPDYEFKISATDFLSGNAREWVMEYYNPWAKISIQKRGKPGFDVTFKFAPEKNGNTYFNGDTFTVSITLKNSGEAFAKNVYVDLDTGPLILLSDKSKLHQNLYEIKKGESKNFDIMLTVPEILNEQGFNLSISQKSNDVKGLEYRTINSILIKTLPKLLVISKSMKNRMYLKDTSTVSIMVTNTGTFDIHNIHINDSLNEDFELKSDKLLQWNISLLKPGQDWSTTYSVKPLEANINGFTIPSVNANFLFNNEQYNISSSKNIVIVNGPKMILNKTVSKNIANVGDLITVNVDIKNIGDIGTRVEVRDTLPANVSFKEGIISLTNWLDSGAIQRFNYTIRMDKERKIELPAAICNYTDVEYRGTVRSVLSSEKIVITVGNYTKVSASSNTLYNTSTQVGNTPTSVSTVAPVSTVVIPGFNSIFSIIGIFLIIVCCKMKNVIKRKKGDKNV